MKKTIYIYLYYFILKLFLFFVFFTCRWKILNKKVLFESIKSPRPILLCLWHEQLVFVSRFFKKSSLNFYGIISTHFDAEIYSKLLNAWKIKLIRGSSTRGWANVIKKMIVLFKDSSSIVAVTNDGPKGPAKVAKEGSVSVAQKYNAQIIAVAAKSSRFWRIGSWDNTFIPKPFSTIYVSFSNPYSGPKPATSEEITAFINDNIEKIDRIK